MWIRRCVLTAILAAISCAVFAAPAAAGRSRKLENLLVPAGAPAGPVERFEARDQRLKTDGADPELAKHLKSFDVEPQTFEYTLQLLRADEGFDLYRLTFPSPAETPWPENNVVPAEYYVPKGAFDAAAGKGDGSGKKLPAAVVLDILDGSAILPRIMARAAAQQGVAALYVPMPCYNARRPKGDAHLKYLAEDPRRRTADGMRQTVMDVRRAKAILAARPEVDTDCLGITGISLGGIMTALAAGVDGDFDRVVPILSGGEIASITFSSHETRKIRALMEAAGMREADAKVALAHVEPINFAARLDPRRVLMINARQDEVIPKWTTEALRKAMGEPEIVWVPGTHYSAILSLPTIQQRTIDFLRAGPGDGETAGHPDRSSKGAGEQR